MSEYIVQTIVIDNNRTFVDKEDFKKFYLDNLVNIKYDQLRQFNMTIMDKYGHEHFSLAFVKPNIGILTHKYRTNDEYETSQKYRLQQKKILESKNIEYLISDVLIRDEI